MNPTPATATTAVSQESSAAPELSFTQALDQTAPEDTSIFVAAQRGDVATIRDLILSGKAQATDRDPQNITPLHWAAINAQVPACRLLLEHGAEVDALGGDLVATPLQWAARGGYLYVIQLLIAHGADPTITDSQGYNSLHLVTHSSSIMPLLYLLHQPVGVDARDAQGHTALMWAAYQGDALSVDLLLRHGASPTTVDDAGLTPLHWAVVRGNRVCIRRLIEKGAVLSAKDSEGRTARDMAQELKSLGAWKRALEEGGWDDEGRKRPRPLSERNTRIAIFALPTLVFYLVFKTLAILPWYTGVLLAFAEFFGMHHIVTRVLLNKSSYTENLGTTPYFAGVICGSMIWVLYAWFSRLVYHTPSHSLAHLGFALTFMLCAYNFFRAVTLDPGVCPVPNSDAELKSIIEDLASEGRLNGQTFCVQCMARKPLRSKHCRICERCVGRHDHHCPWVWNCVGANNHRQFVIFVSTLVLGVILFDYLTYSFFSSLDLTALPDSIPSAEPSASCVLPTSLCALTAIDPFLVSVAIWATLQLSWTSILLASQLWQIARQMTTLEVSNLGRYGFMGGRGGLGGGQMGQSAARNGASPETPEAGAPHTHSHGGCSAFFMSILGLDRFTRGRAVDGLARAGTARNPFDLGVVKNCQDFWSKGRELGVQYERLYDVPLEGFAEAKRRREQEEMADGGDEAGAKARQQWRPVHRAGFANGQESRRVRAAQSGLRTGFPIYHRVSP
ncbi:Palmitoyltransferase [Mycena indigotica]|uniref:Palmitoyltransferase n=1 Tax=Mycena indigotica TaxID=2126181 RepID=A0A8H6VPW7_9AGAR|nr:Palmitoyltransferase [Mycena indigotica]KAF7289334.1 Palmitoyltransferase [Mycena indigotica]